MGFIEEYYNGKLEPQKRNLKQNSAYMTDFSRLCEIEAELSEKLLNDEKRLFIEYVNLWGIISGDLDFAGYKTGFRHGASFAADAFNTENN